MLSTEKCLTVRPGHTPSSDLNNKSARNSHIPPKYYKGLMKLTNTIPAYTRAPSSMYTSPPGPSCQWLWGWAQWVGGRVASFCCRLL